MIDSFYDEILSFQDLTPNDKINTFFTKLYDFCIKNDTDTLEVNDKVLEINKICAEAEYQMELFYVQKIIDSNNPKKELKDFMYYKNYEDLTKLEFINMSFFYENIKNILFIGSGPFPLTWIILAQKYNIKVTLLDISKEAIELSQKLIKKLWLEDNFEFICSDILDFKSNKNFDGVFLASLVLQNTNNEEIFKTLHTKIIFKNLLIRTSHEIRQLLYKKIDTNILSKYFKIQLIIHPKNNIINSFILSTKK